MKYTKKELKKKIEKFASKLGSVLATTKKDDFDLLPELCEILEGKSINQIVREVGEMSSNQWGNYLELTLKGINKIY
jgi:hypothetical protein